MPVGGSAVGGSNGVGLGSAGRVCSTGSTVRVGSGGRVVESGREDGGSSAWETCSGSEGTGMVGDLVGPVAIGSGCIGSATGGVDTLVFCRSIGCNGSGGGGFGG